jgi:glycosyltransferase involved in cell wall biosynthesis
LKSENKKTPRLVEAAKKYGFNLKLAGHLMGESERLWLNNLIDGAKNIEYVGEVSENALIDLYRRAKVFALPSLQEGVGMVALEAAAYGCEIVLTNFGAPKEYYDSKAILVNPKSVDEIGKAIMKAMNQSFAQPSLKKYIEDNYSEQALMIKLNGSIEKALSNA